MAKGCDPIFIFRVTPSFYQSDPTFLICEKTGSLLKLGQSLQNLLRFIRAERLAEWFLEHKIRVTLKTTKKSNHK